MKTKNTIWITTLFIALAIALVYATFNQPSVSAKDLSAASISRQTTPTPAAEDASVIGSTDGIFIMGIVIVLTVTVPILFYRKHK
jgi:hypothetical protein